MGFMNNDQYYLISTTKVIYKLMIDFIVSHIDNEISAEKYR